MAEWSKAAVLKTVEGASPPGVRIPISPPFCTQLNTLFGWVFFAFINYLQNSETKVYFDGRHYTAFPRCGFEKFIKR